MIAVLVESWRESPRAVVGGVGAGCALVSAVWAWSWIAWSWGLS